MLLNNVLYYVPSQYSSNYAYGKHLHHNCIVPTMEVANDINRMLLVIAPLIGIQLRIHNDYLD